MLTNVLSVATSAKSMVAKLPGLGATCQCGSKTGRDASQPAVAFCFSSVAPQPSKGRTVNAHLAELTVEGRFPLTPSALGIRLPVQTSPCNIAYQGCSQLLS